MNIIKFNKNSTIAGIAFVTGSFPKRICDSAPANIVKPINALANSANGL